MKTNKYMFRKFRLKKNYRLIRLVLLLVFCLLAVAIIGTIKKKSNNYVSSPVNQCKSSKTVDESACWQNLIDSTLKEKGIKEAFVVFDNLYKTQPQFASGCHGYAHLLGAAAYKLYVNGMKLEFPPQTAYCGYGFYHGLTELLIEKKGPKEAGKLCDGKKSQITHALYDACYHGIGHGALSSSARVSKTWADPQKIINSALTICSQATQDSIERLRCASGVFMELGNDYTEGLLSQSLDHSDPLKICRQQQEAYKMDCYSQMYGVLAQVSQGDFGKAARFIEDIPEDNYAIASMIDLGGAIINIEGEQNSNILVCRSVQERLHAPCIQGILLAFMLKGQPGVEYNQAINFCNSRFLTEEEKKACFDLFFKQSHQMYTHETIAILCKKVTPKYNKKYCSTL